MTEVASPSPITINLIQFGNREEVELPEGATYGDVQEQVGENLDIRSGAERISERPETPVTPGERFTAQPSSLKNGS